MLKFLERTCFVFAGILIVAAAIGYADRTLQRSAALEAFHEAQAESVTTSPGRSASDSPGTRIDDLVSREARDTVAVLRIEALDIEVPVFDSTDALALNRGAGHVAGTTLPGDTGNIAIAGHRDGFFRKLKDVEAGMSISLLSASGRQEYEVSSLKVVDPLDVSVLSPEGDPRITLITCYPFYYVGPAPDRFIVTARLVGPARDSVLAAGQKRAGSTPGGLQ